jgi:hypothetical protein
MESETAETDDDKRATTNKSIKANVEVAVVIF